MTMSLDILDRLIAFETESSQSNLKLIDYVEDFLVARGFRVTRIPDLTEAKAGLFAEIGPACHGGILLSAHSDVVPVSGQAWTRPPFRLTAEGDRLFGRGTTDMKGFLAEMLAAADKASRQALNRPLKLVISYDEEIGCVGIARMQERLRTLVGGAELAIVGEPTKMQVATGHKGKRAYRARFTGQAGHSALAPNFTNALHVAVDFVAALRGLQDGLRQSGNRDTGYDIPFSTIHVGRVEGGTALNIVPENAAVTFEFRHLAEDDPDELEQRVKAASQAVVARYGSTATAAFELLASYPGLSVPCSDPAVILARSWTGGDTGQVAFGTEAGFLVNLGIPTVVCGPGSMEGQGHKADEYVTREQLDRCAAMLDKSIEHLRT